MVNGGARRHLCFPRFIPYGVENACRAKQVFPQRISPMRSSGAAISGDARGGAARKNAISFNCASRLRRTRGYFPLFSENRWKTSAQTQKKPQKELSTFSTFAMWKMWRETGTLQSAARLRESTPRGMCLWLHVKHGRSGYSAPSGMGGTAPVSSSSMRSRSTGRPTMFA